MSLIESTCRAVTEPDAQSGALMRAALDAKTKPQNSLGRLEELAVSLAAMRGSAEPAKLHKVVVVIAGDHGVADEGVSAFPAEVTQQMLANFSRGGAAINVLARQAGAELVVVDMGSKAAGESAPAGVRCLRVARGTRSFAREPAMTGSECELAVERGILLARELVQAGAGVLALGEMGIANTTSASALTAVFTGSAASDVTGSGTGVSAGVRAHKIEIIERALRLHAPVASDPMDALAKLGGLEIAGLVGLSLGGAACRVPVVLDGFITGAAALVAARLAPVAARYFIASHRSREPGHARALEALRLRPLLELDLCLGEGTGAALALPLIDAAFAIARDMATFESAGVSRRSEV